MMQFRLVPAFYLLVLCRGQYLYRDAPYAKDVIKEYDGGPLDHFYDFQSPGFVEFYSPHCSHCRQFTAQYARVAKQTQEQNPRIQFYGVSCGSHLEYCQQVGVRGYPAFYKIDGGNKLRYIKSGTHGIDDSFVLSLFHSVQTVEVLPPQLKASVTLQKVNAEAQPLSGTAPLIARLGVGRLSPQKGKIEEVPSSGATISMKANIPGTTEQLRHKQAMVESIRRTKGYRKAEKVKQLMETAPNVLPYQKMVPITGLREMIPFVSSTVKFSTEEELIIDTAVSFAYSLRNDVFLKGEELSESETKALKDWLILLSVSLPQEWVLTSVVDEVLKNVEDISKNPALLEKVLRKHRILRTHWSPSCRRHGGFTCGFWKLLHTVTIGVAEHRGGKTIFSQRFNAISPLEAADIIRDFIANFFRCRECAAHFIASYDECSFGRCDLLTDNAQVATDSEWKEVAKWLWKFHNAVSVRVWKERRGSGARNQGDEIQAIWPTISDCWTCYRPDGSWDEDAVFLQLERSYWSGSDIDSRTARLLNFASQIQPPTTIRAYAIVSLLILLVGYRTASPYVKGFLYGPKRSD